MIGKPYETLTFEEIIEAFRAFVPKETTIFFFYGLSNAGKDALENAISPLISQGREAQTIRMSEPLTKALREEKPELDDKLKGEIRQEIVRYSKALRKVHPPAVLLLALAGMRNDTPIIGFTGLTSEVDCRFGLELETWFPNTVAIEVTASEEIRKDRYLRPFKNKEEGEAAWKKLIEEDEVEIERLQFCKSYMGDKLVIVNDVEYSSPSEMIAGSAVQGALEELWRRGIISTPQHIQAELVSQAA
ncbi:MAG: hypothetical protein K0S20_279 [Patescibacteria group bacterium]|nr:hypothetical protein [Patescibacteria group bacterium]